MSMKTYASILAADFEEKKDFTSINKFRKGPTHYKLWLYLLDNYINKVETTSESLMVYLSKYASRKTISVALTELEDQHLIIRKKSLSDNRIVLIEPSQTTIQEFNQWIQGLKKELNSV